ncbi:MAG: hypothetical protein ACRC9N_02490 [Aeromonas sp.]
MAQKLAADQRIKLIKIMVDLGEYCHHHIVPRLKKVIYGEDQGGISKTVNW